VSGVGLCALIVPSGARVWAGLCVYLSSRGRERARIGVCVRIMAIKLRTLDGKREFVVFPDRREILFRGWLYGRPRVHTGYCRYVDVGVDDFRQTWPEIDNVVWVDGDGMHLHFVPYNRLIVDGRAHIVMYLDARAVTVKHVNIMERYLRRRIIWLRKLAVGMMTHARLGKACELNRVAEVVKMVMEAM